jgi:hypothetical protein
MHVSEAAQACSVTNRVVVCRENGRGCPQTTYVQCKESAASYDCALGEFDGRSREDYFISKWRAIADSGTIERTMKRSHSLPELALHIL